ncbi:hypothetical protein JCM5296_002144 [Sporobolomyces johnsonii]
MAAEYDTKAVLLDWMKEGENKLCAECSLPSPQWCSLSYGCSLCLTCSGVHRSLGVHLSFVRSLTMDKWTQAQMQRMLKGGNQKVREFFEANGQPWKVDSLAEKYNSHVAAMYRDKLLADAEDRPWVPTDTPVPSSTTTSSSSLRKPRAQQNSRGVSPSSFASNNSSPTPRSGSPATASAGGPTAQKAANEDYFARMGAANESRRADLPPSQGGKYQGFGSQGPSTAGGGRGAVHPMSSRALPGLEDLRDDPVGALGKGWGFLGAALGAVGKTVNDSVVQPTLERAHDPALQSQFSTFLSSASSRLTLAARASGQALSTGLESGSQFLRRDLGVDVGDLGAHYLDRATGRGAGEGYGAIGEEHAPRGHSGLEPGEGDFFESHLGGGGGSAGMSPSSSSRCGGGGAYYDDNAEDAGGYQDMPTMRREGSTMSSTTAAKPVVASPPPPVVVEGSWESMAPKAAAARAAAAKAKASAPAKKNDDGWDDFGDDWN